MSLKDNSHTALIDFDTIVYASAAAIQKNPINVKHTASGRVKQYDNITAFRDWLKLKEKWKEEEFTWEVEPVLADPVSHAIQIIKNKVESIESQSWCSDIKIFVGGKGNFRKDIYDNYKGNRGPKPLAFQDCYNYVLKRWKDCVVVCDGYEAEDHAAVEGYNAYLKCRDSRDKQAGGKVICHVDKDVDMIPGFHFNYSKPEQGVWWQDNVSGYKCFATQMLIGDRSTDNIRGVEVVVPEVKELFGVTTKSIGEASAKKILKDLNTEKDLLARLVEVYKLTYGDDWKAQMDFTGKLVWITREYKQPFDIDKELERLEVE